VVDWCAPGPGPEGDPPLASFSTTTQRPFTPLGPQAKCFPYYIEKAYCARWKWNDYGVYGDARAKKSRSWAMRLLALPIQPLAHAMGLGTGITIFRKGTPMLYVKGMLIGLGSVAAFYAALRCLPLVFATYAAFHHPNAPLKATAGGGVGPSIEFWLWALIVFAASFLIYLRVVSAR
jgi:hypothetical protein